MGARAKKATFSLREDVLAAVNEVVARGATPSCMVKRPSAIRSS